VSVPGETVFRVWVDGIEVARAHWHAKEGTSIIQCRFEGVPNPRGVATMLRRIATQLSDT
jgi:hypothetical protein